MPENTSNPTPEQIAAALRCLDTNMPCGDCYYQAKCRRVMDRDAADLIEEMNKEMRHLRRKAKDLADLLVRKPKTTNAPTVDAVQVVRCRDCKNLIAFADGHHSCGFKPFGGGVSAMDYCSRGERRVNDG